MVGRHIRMAGLRLIEEKLAKTISAPSLSSLRGKKMKELGVRPPDTKVPKVVALPQQ